MKKTGIVKRNKVYFFSDVHLGMGLYDAELLRERELIGFLDHVKKDACQIFIVGDLFDYWFEYKTVILKGFLRLLAKLSELTEMGVKVSLVCGNHDYWTRDYLQRELGLQVYKNPVSLELLGKRFFIHHGDGITKGDIGYKILKKILRNKINIFLFYLLHPDIATFIAKYSSRKSRYYRDGNIQQVEELINFAKEKIRQGCDFVIMGHNHIPMIKEIEHGVYVNLGDWINRKTYAVFDGKSIELKEWH